MPLIAGGSLLPSVAEARTHSNVLSTAGDTELQGFLLAAARALRFWVGPIDAETVTNEVRDGGSPVIFLDVTPVLSIQSVTEYIGTVGYGLTAQPLGQTQNLYGYSLDDPDKGKVVRRSSSGGPMGFLTGPRSVLVSYTAGRSSLPEDLRLAVLELTRDMWAGTQSGGGGRAFGQSPAEAEPMFTAGRPPLPPYVIGLIQPYLRTVGVLA